jgi:hypothetical protein
MKAVITPDSRFELFNQYPREIPKVFLGGSIEMGKAKNWQEMAIEALDECIIFNPRRDDWDSSWEQIPSPDTQFGQQVEWEIRAQQNSDIIIYNFESDTQSPITLLELGFSFNLPAHKVVCCPKEYFRHGNVVITTNLLGGDKSMVFTNFDEMLQSVKWKINDLKYKNNCSFSEWVNMNQGISDVETNKV